MFEQLNILGGIDYFDANGNPLARCHNCNKSHNTGLNHCSDECRQEDFEKAFEVPHSVEIVDGKLKFHKLAPE